MLWKTAAVSRLSVLVCLLPIHLQLLKLAWEGGTKKSKYQHRISVTLSEVQNLGGARGGGNLHTPTRICRVERP